MKQLARFVFAGSLMALTGCAVADVDEPVTPAVAPQFGPADASDVSDRECQVVLRDVARAADEDSEREEFEVNCTDGRCWHVWEGTMEVIEGLADLGRPGVLYRSREGDWYEASVEPTDGAIHGFDRFSFRLDQHTIVQGVPSMTMARAKLELIPFISANGRRYFDHNATDGETSNYVLSASNEFSYTHHSSVCPAKEHAVLSFHEDWSEEQEGKVVPGGTIRIEYDLARLPQCQGRFHNGQLAWQVGVSVRFADDGEVLRRQVMEADGAEAVPSPPTIVVPSDADYVEMWFHTSGAECETHYDSNMDKNYRFEIAR